MKRLKLHLKQGFYYEFSEGDYKRIQDLINELRTKITESKIPEKHRERLLKRLESLQKEFHKRMTNLDKFYGVLIETSTVVREFCEDAEPILKVIYLILKITAISYAIAHGLPSRYNSLPLLLPGSNDDGIKSVCTKSNLKSPLQIALL